MLVTADVREQLVKRFITLSLLWSTAKVISDHASQVPGPQSDLVEAAAPGTSVHCFV